MQERGHGFGAKTGWVSAVGAGLMAGEWILLVAGTKVHEMMVGATVVVASACFLRAVQRSSTLRVRFRWGDVAAVRWVPRDVAEDLWRLTVVLVKDLLQMQRAASHYRVSGFKTSKHDPVLVARRVLATGYTTASPNTIVIGIDYAQSRMLFHQIERRELSKATRKLGARS